jgi:hypothetical protein
MDAAAARRRRCRPIVTLAAALAALAGCTPHPVGPARTSASFEGKAVTTAESALSAVESVRLAARTGSEGHGFGPYLSVLVSEQEELLAGVQGTFDSIQPPGEGADELRSELDDLLRGALAPVADVRIAARRGELAGLAEAAAPLGDDSEALDRFIEEHRS